MNCLVIMQIYYLYYSTCNFAIPGTFISGKREREGRQDSGKHLSLNHDQAHKLSGIIGGANMYIHRLLPAMGVVHHRSTTC